MFYDVKKLEIALVTPDNWVISASKAKRTDSSAKRSNSKEFGADKEEAMYDYDLKPNSISSGKQSGPLSSVVRNTMIKSIR